MKKKEKINRYKAAEFEKFLTIFKTSPQFMILTICDLTVQDSEDNLIFCLIKAFDAGLEAGKEILKR